MPAKHKDVLALTLGTGFGQAFALLCVPLLSRLYSPHAYGIFGVVQVTTALVSLCGTLQYQFGIVIGEADEVAPLLALCRKLTIWMTVLCAFGMLGWRVWTSGGQLTATDYAWLVTVGAVAASARQLVGESLLNRHKLYRQIGTARSLNALAMNGFALLIGLVLPNELGLSLAFAVGLLVQVGMQRQALRRAGVGPFEPVTGLQVRGVAKKYRDFPRTTFVQSFIDQLRMRVFLNLLGTGTAAPGYYGMASRIYEGPLAILSSSLTMVLTRHYAEAVREQKGLFRFTIKVVAASATLCIAISLIFVVAGDRLLPFVLGEKWRMANSYVVALIPWVVLRLVVTPLSSLPMIYRRQRMYLAMGVVYAVVVPALLYWGMRSGDPVEALAFVAKGAAAYLVLQVIWLCRLTLRAPAA